MRKRLYEIIEVADENDFQKALPAGVITGGYIDAIKHKKEKE